MTGKDGQDSDGNSVQSKVPTKDLRLSGHVFRRIQTKALVGLLALGILIALGVGATAFKQGYVGAAQVAVESLGTVVPGAVAVDWLGPVDGIDAGPVQNEEQAAIYYPADAAAAAQVVLLQHGGHSPCRAADDPWPCSAPDQRTPSYLGYGYLGEALASAGYVVVSISANSTVAGADTENSALVFNHWIRNLQTANTTSDGPLGNRLTGRIDLGSVNLIGHSRGGDAVARYASIDTSVSAVRPIKAMVLLAPVVPVDFNETGTMAPSSVPARVTTGTCDGDAGLDGEQYMPFLTSPDSELRQVKGANHNAYSTQWTPGEGVPDAVDDAITPTPLPGCSPGDTTRLTVDQQRDTAVTLITTFLRAH